MECIILSVNDTYMDAQEVMHMTDYSKITALYSRLSVGDEDRDGGESNSIQNQKIFLENYARGQHLTNIRHYIDDDESGRFFDRSAYGTTPFSRPLFLYSTAFVLCIAIADRTTSHREYAVLSNIHSTAITIVISAIRNDTALQDQCAARHRKTAVLILTINGAVSAAVLYR